MTTKSHAILKIIKAFEAFDLAYDTYLREVECALPEDIEDEALRERIRALALGSGDVSIYLRNYGYTIDSMRGSLARQ